jgi:hypothetical protein
VTLREVVTGWDFSAAIGCSAVVWFLLPDWPSNAFASAIYEMGITVLSIVFAVFFTALAVLIAAGDDDFVSFLKDLGIYSGIIATYRFALIVLFVALMYSVIAFGWTAAIVDADYTRQSKYVVVLFAFLFFYSLFSVIYSTYDALEYSQRRIEFVEAKRAGKLGPTPNKPADPPPSKASGQVPPP